MEDKELTEDLYSVAKLWFVSRVVLEPSSRRLDAFLDHEENCTWRCLLCNKEYCISDRAKERIWRDLDSGIYQVYLHACIPRVECLEHGKVRVRIPWTSGTQPWFLALRGSRHMESCRGL